MSVETVAAVVALIAGLVLFFRGMMMVRRKHPGPQGHLMMWGGIAVIMAGGFATSAENQLGFIMVIGAFALLGQGLAETVRARRGRNNRPW